VRRRKSRLTDLPASPQQRFSAVAKRSADYAAAKSCARPPAKRRSRASSARRARVPGRTAPAKLSSRPEIMRAAPFNAFGSTGNIQWIRRDIDRDSMVENASRRELI